MVELMAQFDPVMNEHLRRIQQKETKFHYLRSQIPKWNQRTNWTKTNWTNFYCLESVVCEPSSLNILLDLLMFRTPLETLLLENLARFSLNIADCYGQSYDNGSNMLAHRRGVQSRILQVNETALCPMQQSHTQSGCSQCSQIFSGLNPLPWCSPEVVKPFWLLHSSLGSFTATCQAINHKISFSDQMGIQDWRSVQKKDSETMSTATSIILREIAETLETDRTFAVPGREEAQSTPEEHFHREFSSPWWTQPLAAWMTGFPNLKMLMVFFFQKQTCQALFRVAHSQKSARPRQNHFMV